MVAIPLHGENSTVSISMASLSLVHNPAFCHGRGTGALSIIRMLPVSPAQAAGLICRAASLGNDAVQCCRMVYNSDARNARFGTIAGVGFWIILEEELNSAAERNTVKLARCPRGKVEDQLLERW